MNDYEVQPVLMSRNDWEWLRALDPSGATEEVAPDGSVRRTLYGRPVFLYPESVE